MDTCSWEHYFTVETTMLKSSEAGIGEDLLNAAEKQHASEEFHQRLTRACLAYMAAVRPTCALRPCHQ
jgi:hypothetical protein